MKYVIFQNGDVVIFTGGMSHRTVAEKLGGFVPRIVAAGFVHLMDGQVSAGGDSLTLGIGSRPEDTDIIKRQLGFF